MTNEEKREEAGCSGADGIISSAMQNHSQNKTRRLNHAGCLYLRGRTWYATWQYHGKRQWRSTGCTDRNAALRKLDAFTRCLQEESVEDTILALKQQLERLQAHVAKKELPLEEVWGEFAKAIWDEGVGEKTLAIYERNVTHMVSWMKRHGTRNASGVSVAKADSYLKELRENIGAVAWNQRLVLFKRVWARLSERGYQLENSWEGFKKQKGVKHSSERRALSDEEIRRIEAHADADLRLFSKIAKWTGLRVSDVCRLKWKDVNLESGVISVVPLKTSKTGKKVIIPMHPELKEALLEARKESSGEFVNANLEHLYRTGQITDKVNKLFTECGIETHRRDENGRLRFVCGAHSYRHHFAQKASQFMSLSVIQRILGHASQSMTEMYADHIDSDMVRTMREGIERMKVA